MVTDFPSKDRLGNFLRTHYDQLDEPNAQLLFKIRAGDAQKKVENYILAKGFAATINVKAGQGTSREDERLTQQAVDAIFRRARNVFKHNINPPRLRRGRDIRSVGLRTGDRLAALPDSDKTLEDALATMAKEMKSIYSVSGKYGGGVGNTERSLFEYLKSEFNQYHWNVPFPVVEALFRGKTFELQFVYDEINGDKPQTPKRLDLAKGDNVIIIAYEKVRRRYHAACSPYRGNQFEIPYSSNYRLLRVFECPAEISPRTPLLCVDMDYSAAEAEELPTFRYEVRMSEKGKLYVVSCDKGGEDSWRPIGWGMKERTIPGDDTAYQILKAVAKNL